LKRSYHTIDKQGKVSERKLAEFLFRNGQALLPMMELIEQSRLAIDELIDVMGRASLEAVLELSAQQVAGPPQQGKARQQCCPEQLNLRRPSVENKPFVPCLGLIFEPRSPSGTALCCPRRPHQEMASCSTVTAAGWGGPSNGWSIQRHKSR
jgi:hypothetical protein